jgi:hypothetical protein
VNQGESSLLRPLGGANSTEANQGNEEKMAILCFLRLLGLKSEIEMAGMRQAVGAETVWKNRSHTRGGLVRFFQTVYAQQIDADRPFLFRISG